MKLISRVGDDDLGRDLLDRLQKCGVATECLQVDLAVPTGTAAVEVDGAGQPRFVIHENVAWDHLVADPAGRAAVSAADAVCFGTLAQRLGSSRSAIRSLLDSAQGDVLRVFDVNLRQHYYSRAVVEDSLIRATALKLNEMELPCLSEMFGHHGDERKQIERLAERFQLDVVAYTRGGNGSLLFAAGRWSNHPGVPANVRDTVGAGDSFTAAMTLGLLAGWDLDEINVCANVVAAYVASCDGATPPLPGDLCRPFRDIRR